jgi:hypothetical protein
MSFLIQPSFGLFYPKRELEAFSSTGHFHVAQIGLYHVASIRRQNYLDGRGVAP